MFALFFSLYVAMFYGSWEMFTWPEIFSSNGIIRGILVKALNSIGSFITSIFTDATTFDTLGTDMISNGNIIFLVAFILALITSIGIVVMAVKGVKKAFGIFFMGIRNI